MARPKGLRKPSADPLDGAQYWNRSAKPADYMTDKTTGLRKGEKEKPHGRSMTTLEHGIKHVTLPPRSVWVLGSYLLEWAQYDVNSNDNDQDRDLRTWVTSGEGTPGNFEERHYVVPDEISGAAIPEHPADWKASVFKKSPFGYPTDGTVTTKGGKKPAAKAAPPLPVGIRFRDPNCGHWFREGDLAGHSKVCPGTQGGESDWAIACECCESLDDTAKCKPGFPRPKPPVAEKPEEEPQPEPETLPATFDTETKPGEPLKETPKKPIKGREGGKGGDGTPAT